MTPFGTLVRMASIAAIACCECDIALCRAAHAAGALARFSFVRRASTAGSKTRSTPPRIRASAIDGSHSRSPHSRHELFARARPAMTHRDSNMAYHHYQFPQFRVSS
ncbi:hypothetical protein WI23_30370 [Burkholderia oklahomensis C6786]|nr:hypothetical protein WI23_30370 [Burkholderia oklahomensis C6786]KUY53084.1 hypothetical protein WI23_23080 [Burkholderia oklahomensis C6786]